MKKFLCSFTLLLLMMTLTSCSSKIKEMTKPKISNHIIINFIQKKIRNMTLEEKIGQMIIVGFEGQKVNDKLKYLITNRNISGVILFDRNIKDKNQLLGLVNDLKLNSKNDFPMFISLDEEGGAVSRLPNGVTEFPSNKEIAKNNDKGLSYEIGNVIGKELKIFGFNMNFAPVLDIHSNKNNKVIGNRSFGNSENIVSELGIATMKGLQKQDIISVVKHFPGHGDTMTDSHIGLPIIKHGLERIENFEMIPFQNAIDSGVDAIMVGHIMYPNIDKSNKPASLSKVMITSILREKMKFNGVVISDDMEMGAITNNYGTKESVLLAIKAGVDLLLMCHEYEKQLIAIKTIKEAVENGIIKEEKINKSVERILLLKKSYKLNNALNESHVLNGLNEKGYEIIKRDILR